MSDEELIALVRELRHWQRDFFKTKSREALNKSMELERRVDKELTRRMIGQATLI